MRFSVGLPTDRGGEFVSARAIGEMARAAEDAGFDACFVTDHPIPGDRWLRSGGHHALDPFVALSFAGAATSRLQLATNVLVLAYRNPFLSAKAAASLDAASGGRLILGVAAGYLEPEFEALGVDFGERNELTDEAIGTMKRAWSEEGLEISGRHFRATGNTALPRPARVPHPPIWIGGNSRRAIRRAVELGDGWLPFPAPAGVATRIRTRALESLDDLRAGIAYARAHASSIGRTQPLEICFVPFELPMGATGSLDASALAGRLPELEDAGVSWLSLNVPCQSPSDYGEKLATLAADLGV